MPSIAMSEPHSVLGDGGGPVLPSLPTNVTAKALALISHSLHFLFFFFFLVDIMINCVRLNQNFHSLKIR